MESKIFNPFKRLLEHCPKWFANLNITKRSQWIYLFPIAHSTACSNMQATDFSAKSTSTPTNPTPRTENITSVNATTSRTIATTKSTTHYVDRFGNLHIVYRSWIQTQTRFGGDWRVRC